MTGKSSTRSVKFAFQFYFSSDWKNCYFVHFINFCVFCDTVRNEKYISSIKCQKVKSIGKFLRKIAIHSHLNLCKLELRRQKKAHWTDWLWGCNTLYSTGICWAFILIYIFCYVNMINWKIYINLHLQEENEKKMRGCCWTRKWKIFRNTFDLEFWVKCSVWGVNCMTDWMILNI